MSGSLTSALRSTWAARLCTLPTSRASPARFRPGSKKEPWRHPSNAVVPAEAVRPGLELVVEIDPDGTLDPSLGVRKRIPDAGRLAMDVRKVPEFDLTLVPFLWFQAPDSAIIESVAATVEDPEYWLWARAPYLPVGDLVVRAHEPVMSSSNNAWRLLSETYAIRAMEGGIGYYMGTMSRPVTGAKGVAPIGAKALFSLLPGPTAHELGHSFSLYHAPCGGAGGPDPAYPYDGAQIGAWGYDPRNRTLVSPETTDLMSYCGGWISDYHYTKALRHRMLNDGVEAAAAAAPTMSLLLWGGMDADSVPHLEPAFVVNAPPALPDSAGDHRVTGRSDARGGAFLVQLRDAPGGRRGRKFGLCLRAPGARGLGEPLGHDHAYRPRRIRNARCQQRSADGDSTRSPQRTGARHPPGYAATDPGRRRRGGDRRRGGIGGAVQPWYSGGGGLAAVMSGRADPTL